MKRETAMVVKPQQEQEQEQEQLRLESGRHVVNIFFLETLSDQVTPPAPAPAPRTVQNC